MITAPFHAEAMARLRFAISPMIELVTSLKALEDAATETLHLPWAQEAREQTADLDLSALNALSGSNRYNPDFIHPLPTGPTLDFECGLAAMLAMPAELIESEVRFAYREHPLPAVLEPFLENPRAAVRGLSELMASYWERALSPHWQRVRSLLEQDVQYRARQIADGGTRRLFADLHDAVRWDDGVLYIDQCDDATLDLDERGLLLIPSAFRQSKVMVVSAPRWQPTLIYPARGVGMLWEPAPAAPPDALAKLVGRNRAALLLALDFPRSTGQLAEVVGVSNGGVSQQLSILADAGLVRRRRVARHVLYLRSLDGDALVEAATRAAA
jgi:DNA-binding transcriptional ArsR family regulator